jgi:ribonuclease D
MSTDPRPLEIVTDPASLARSCAALRRSPRVALDTEFMRERTYHAQLCLVQLADAGRIVVVDPLVCGDLKPLHELLADTAVLKVLHSGRQDLEIFAQQMGAVPAPLFDTQVAAALLGLGDQIGYANLVQRLLSVTLEKLHTRIDWSVRPLPPGAMEYAADDVRYLLAVHDALRAELGQRERLEWLDAEFAQLARLDSYRTDPADAWRKVRGSQRLTEPQRARLAALAAWRERTALELDRPRGWVLKDDVIVDIARRNPTDERALAELRDMPPAVVKRRGAEILAALAAAGGADAPAMEPPRARLTPEQDGLVDLLAALTRKRAAEHGVAVANLATRKELERLVLGERELEVLSGWKRATVGEALLAALDGKVALAVRDGKLVELG